MIDPLGPDPDNASSHPRQIAQIVSEFETPGLLSPLRPKVRHANYDSPEAIVLRTPPAEPAAKVKAATPPPKPGPTALARSVPKQQKSTFERALGMARTVLPLVGKMLPLLEGNVVSAASNLLLNHSVQEVDLKPLEESIARIQADQRALTFHTSEQKRAIRQLEDDFAALQESVQKNAADQAELIEHVAKLAKRTSSFMRLVVILLVVSILFTALLCVRIAYIIRY
ncbi:MAG: hypothetical protein WA354_13515 [Terracidiphilus sp.]